MLTRRGFPAFLLACLLACLLARDLDEMRSEVVDAMQQLPAPMRTRMVECFDPDTAAVAAAISREESERDVLGPWSRESRLWETTFVVPTPALFGQDVLESVLEWNRGKYRHRITTATLVLSFTTTSPVPTEVTVEAIDPGFLSLSECNTGIYDPILLDPEATQIDPQGWGILEGSLSSLEALKTRKTEKGKCPVTSQCWSLRLVPGTRQSVAITRTVPIFDFRKPITEDNFLTIQFSTNDGTHLSKMSLSWGCVSYGEIFCAKRIKILESLFLVAIKSPTPEAVSLSVSYAEGHGIAPDPWLETRRDLDLDSDSREEE